MNVYHMVLIGLIFVSNTTVYVLGKEKPGLMKILLLSNAMLGMLFADTIG